MNCKNCGHDRMRHNLKIDLCYYEYPEEPGDYVGDNLCDCEKFEPSKESD